MPIKYWNNYLQESHIDKLKKKVAVPHQIFKELRKHHCEHALSLCRSTGCGIHESKLNKAVTEWDNILTLFADKRTRKFVRGLRAAADQVCASFTTLCWLRDREVFEILRIEGAKKRVGANLNLMFDKVQKILNETVKNQAGICQFLITLSEPVLARPQRLSLKLDLLKRGSIDSRKMWRSSRWLSQTYPATRLNAGTRDKANPAPIHKRGQTAPRPANKW